MKDLHNYIFEKLNLKDIKRQYSCCPKTRYELRKILEERLKENKNADLIIHHLCSSFAKILIVI